MELLFLYFSKYLNFGFIIKTHNLKFLTSQKMKGKKIQKGFVAVQGHKWSLI